MANPLALHTWTLDTTPLPRVLEIVRDTGWNAVELRRLDFARAAERGQAAPAVLDLVRRSGLATACVGVELGWMYAAGDERARLLRAFDESCGWAAALGCRTVMSPVDRGRGDLAHAAASVAEVGDIAGRHGVRLALEFNSQCEQFNTLASLREVLSRARHPHVGLLVDAYHMERSGGQPSDLDDVPAADIAYVQFSDVPRSGLVPGQALKAKLSLLITAVLVLAIVLVVIVLQRQQQESLTAEMTKRGRAIAENLAAGAKTSLLQRDDLTLTVLVKDAMKDGDIRYIIIADENGQIRAHSDLNKIGDQVERPAPLAPARDELTVTSYRSSRGGIIDFAVPLTFSRVRLGALYLGFSEESIVAAVRKARRQAALVTLGMVSLGIAAAVGLATLLARPIFRLVGGTRAIAEGDFSVSLPVTSHDELGTLTQAFNQMARSLREKEMIKRAFSRYVAREVVEEVLKDPEQLQLKGERREVTVLFCDVRGFTPMSERLTPEQVVSLLNDFYTL